MSNSSPFQGEYLAGAAAGEQEQPNVRDGLRSVGFVARKHRTQSANLGGRQEALAAPAPISPDAGARVGSLRPVAVDLGLAHDDREDRCRAVRCPGGVMERREPASDVIGGDVAYRAAAEPGQDMVAVVAAVDLEGLGFPVAGVSPVHFLGDRLEGDVCRRASFRVVSLLDRRHQCPGPGTGLLRTDDAGVTHDLPDPLAPALTMDEIPLGARGRTLTPKPVRSRSRTS